MRRLLVFALTLAIGYMPYAISSSLAKETGEDRPVGSLGGAVHADPFTGVATTSIPIEVPPGRNGMQPSLALTYNSAAGNGWLGMGWDLQQEGIYRQTKWGVDYSNNNGPKAFTMKMAGVGGDLVPSPAPAPSTQWSTKVEGGFSRIEKLTAVDGQITWKVTTKQGRKYFFGQTTASRQYQVTPLAADKIFGWLLDRVEDLDGNYMTYSYSLDATNNQVYLDHIDYAGNGATVPTNSIKFWLDNGSRPDQGDMYSTNYRVKTKYRLKTVEIKANSQLTRAYRLCYFGSASPCPVMPGTSASSLLSTVQQFGKDATLDVAGTVLGGTSLPSLSISYDVTALAGGVGAKISSSPYVGPTSTWTVTHVDVNGDGRADAVATAINNNAQWQEWVALSNGDGTFGPKIASVPHVGPTSTWTVTHVDVNGDGKADAVATAINNNAQWQEWVAPALGGTDLAIAINNGFGGATTITYAPSTQWPNAQLPFPIQRVWAIGTCDNWNSNATPPVCTGISSTTTYSYSGGFYHIGERDLRGVNYVKVTGQAAANGDQTISETWFRQGSRIDAVAETVTELQADTAASTKGLPFRTKITDQTGKIYSESTSTYKADADGLVPWFTPPALATTSIYDSAGVVATQTQTESVTYDAYGNLTLAFNRGDWTGNNAITSDDTTTAVTYAPPDTTNWLIGFPTVTTSYAGLGTGGTKLSETKTYYDGMGSCTTPAGSATTVTKGHVTKVERWLNGGTNPISGMEYNSFGGVTCTRDPKGNQTTLAYDPTSTFPLTSTNALGHVTTTSYYGVNGVASDTGLYGQAKTVTDPNSKTTTNTYDA